MFLRVKKQLKSHTETSPGEMYHDASNTVTQSLAKVTKNLQPKLSSAAKRFPHQAQQRYHNYDQER